MAFYFRKINYNAVRYILLSIIAIQISLSVTAQTGRITGYIKDSISKDIVPYASVTLFDINANKPLSGSLVDEKGRFELIEIPYGNYYLSISCIGFRTKVIDSVSLSAQQKRVELTVDLGEDENILEASTITARGNIEYRPDKKIVYIDQAEAAAGISVATALQNLPEIRVDGQNVSLKTYAPIILVNGRPASPMMQDLINLPASMFSSVEVITNPSADYSPEGLGGIINLKLKKEPIGINGMLQGSGGTNSKYTAVGTLNYRTEKWNAFASFYERHDAIKGEGYQHTQYDAGYLVKQNSSFSPKINRISPRVGADFYLDSLNVFTVYWEYSKRKGDATTSNLYEEIGFVNPRNYRIKQDNLMSSNDNQLGFSYTHTFKNNTELNIHATQFWGREPSSIDYYFDGIPAMEYKNKSNFKTNTSNVEIGYSSEIFKTWYLSTGFYHSYRKQAYEDHLEEYDFSQSIWSEQLDNLFKHNRLTESLFFTLEKKIEKISIKAGIRGQYVDEKLFKKNVKFNSRNDVDFFPSMSVSYQAEKGINMTLSYGQRIRRPSLLNLTPYETIDYNYPFNRKIGNPSLNPAKTHSIDFSISQRMSKVSWSIFTSYMRANNDFVNVYYVENDMLYTTWDNLATIQKFIFNASLDYHARLWGVYKPTLNIAMNKDFYDKRSSDGDDISNTHFNYNIGVSNSFYPVKSFSIYFNVTYYPTMYHYASKVESYFDMSLVAQKTFWNTLTLQCSIYNILNQNPMSYSYGNGFAAKEYRNRHDHAVYFGLMYKFGKAIKTRAKVNLNLNRIEMQ